MATLHITNGDSAAEGLKQAQLGGEVLPWRDVLHDGPVPPTSDAATFRATRAAFLAARGAGDPRTIEREFASRDSVVESVNADDDVVLWFEPDLYDQLQLCEVLSRFARRDEGHLPQLTIAPADCLLGPLMPNEFGPLYEQRRPVESAAVRLGERAWQAITSTDPHLVAQFFHAREHEISGVSYSSTTEEALPHLAPAMLRWLQELPWVGCGINRSEQQICTVLSDGPQTLGYTFQHAFYDPEPWIWLGDSSFVWYVSRLGDCTEPLVTFADGSRITVGAIQRSLSSFGDLEVRLTSFGQDVLRGNQDAIEVNGIDRWFGGAHLTTGEHWRWDDVEARTIPHAS